MTTQTTLVYPITALPAYDLKNLSNVYGIQVMDDIKISIDLTRDEAKTGVKQKGSAVLNTLLFDAIENEVATLSFVPQDEYDALGLDDPFYGPLYVHDDEYSDSCIRHFMCPCCGNRDNFEIEVTGPDPDDVDPMESQSRIQRRFAEGNLATATYMAHYFTDGSEDTVGDTTWEDESAMVCSACGHESTTILFTTLHNAA